MTASGMPASTLFWIGLSVFLLGMSKGGFPIGAVALPTLVLVWPEPAQAARSAVGFMLPLLCLMDLFAVAAYRRHIRWSLVRPLLPGAVAGVASASILFLAGETAPIAFSDRALRMAIGLIGIAFCAYRLLRARLLRGLGKRAVSSAAARLLCGLSAGVSSTLAHAAGPVLQMYLLPRGLPKLQYAATTAGFFFLLNLIKAGPFLVFGRITRPNLALGGVLLPLVPMGVAAGYAAVRMTRETHYVALIYGVLFFSSVLLILRTLSA